MLNLRDVASATLGLAWRGAIALVGVAILLGTSSPRDPAPPGDLRGPGRTGGLAGRQDGKVCLTLAVPEGESHTWCIVQDEDGVELMSLYYDANGSLHFNLAESPTVGATGYRLANGEFGFRVGGEGRVFGYSGRPGSPPVVELDNLYGRRLVRYRVTPEGRLLLDPDAPTE
jgi:hypothetical protein